MASRERLSRDGDDGTEMAGVADARWGARAVGDAVGWEARVPASGARPTQCAWAPDEWAVVRGRGRALFERNAGVGQRARTCHVEGLFNCHAHTRASALNDRGREQATERPSVRRKGLTP